MGCQAPVGDLMRLEERSLWQFMEKNNGAVVGDSGRWWESVCFYFTPGCLQCWHSV